MNNLSMDNLTSVLIMFEDDDRIVKKNSSSLKKQQNFNSMNIEKQERGISAKIVEKMTLKRRSTISTGNNDKKLDTSKKSMKNLKK